jgi:rhodanese-related sulfurtransferase
MEGNMAKTFKDFVDDAKTRIREVGIDEVKSQADEATLVDLREDSEWDKGHLPGAVHLSRGVLEVRAYKVLPDKDAPLVLYCGGGNRSALAADVLQEMGYTNVRSMAGGWRAWTAAGLPTETE